MEKWVREIIIDTVRPRISEYIENINQTFENKEVMEFWVKALKSLFDFIDGINLI